MNLQARKIILISIFIIVLVVLFLFIQLMWLSDAEESISRLDLTRTALVLENQTVFPYETATSQTPMGTFMPAPSS